MAETSGSANKGIQGAISSISDAVNNIVETGSNVTGDVLEGITDSESGGSGGVGNGGIASILSGIVGRADGNATSDTGGYGYATGSSEGMSYAIPKAPEPPKRDKSHEIKPSDSPGHTQTRSDNNGKKSRTLFEASGTVDDEVSTTAKGKQPVSTGSKKQPRQSEAMVEDKLSPELELFRDKVKPGQQYIWDEGDGNTVTVDLYDGSITNRTGWYADHPEYDIRDHIGRRLSDSPNPKMWLPNLRLHADAQGKRKNSESDSYPKPVQQAVQRSDLQAQAEAAAEALSNKTPNAPNVPRMPRMPRVPKVQRKETERERFNRVNDQLNERRIDRAADRNVETYASYASWRANNPHKGPNDYFRAMNPRLDNESFQNMEKPPKRGQNLSEYAQDVKRRGLREDADEDYKIQPEKIDKKQERVISQYEDDMVKGFFPIEGMVVEEAEDGFEFFRWSEDMEQGITNLLKYVNKEPTIDNIRNVMRSIRHYASMSFDRRGKMFNEEEDSWELGENNAVDIINMMLLSCKKNGTPFGIVDPNYSLAGTRIFPNGIVPKVLADFWTGPGSNLLNSDGTPMTSAQLVQNSQDEWNQRTHPALVRYAPLSQRIVIEDIARAASMMDGMSAERFSERYGVRSEIDYMINEWQDSNKEYAAAMNEYIDTEIVQARQNELLDNYRKRFDKDRNVSYVYDDDGNLEKVFTNKQPGWVSGLKLATKLMRSASVGLNVPVIVSAFAEHGVGNLTTKATLAALNAAYGTDYEWSDFTLETMKSDEALEAFQCAKELYDAFGPGAVRLFAETGQRYTKENVQQFAAENLKPEVGEKVEAFNKRLDRLTNMLMMADYAFKRSDLQLWFDAYTITNSVMARSQQEMVANNLASQREVALTPEEIESAIRASDMGTFFAQAMGTDAGINAYQMMRANNIGQKSPMSEFATQFLNDHGVTEFAITAFVDTFPRYGINFAYMLMPMSRTISYVRAHHKLQAGEEFDGTSDLLIGGNIEDYQMGLRMNLIYDAFTFGGRSVITGALFGILLNILGFEPPDDDNNKFNVSMWKIGGKVGWGDADEEGNHKGVEVQLAWWMNDLTLLSLPIAYFTAGGLSTGDWNLAKDLMLDGLADTISGNVLLDFAHTVNHFREDYIEFDRMINEPDYNGHDDIWSFALQEAAMTAWKAVGKVNPFDPVVNMFNRDTLFAGESARNRDFWHVWRRSDNEDLDKFYRENNITDKVSYDEYLRRKYSSSNLLFALVNNISSGAFTDDKKTGFFWWDMPARTMGDPLGYAWLGEFFMDLDNIPDDIPGSTAAEKEINYKDQMARHVLEWIDKFDGAPNQAIRAGFTIPEEARKAATNYCYAQISALKAEYVARVDSGELVTFEEQQSARQAMWNEINNKWNVYIYDWLKNDEIPTYATTYEQLLTDWDVTYTWRANGQPAPSWASAIPGATDAVFKPKGNHPTSFAPFTLVDTRDRGYNAETINEWYSDGVTGSDLQWIFDNIGQKEIKFGRDQGKIANDVIFSKQTLTDDYMSLSGPTVIGWRSYVSKHNSGLPDDVKKITEENHEAGKLGETGKYNQDVIDALDGKGKTAKTPTYYPRGSYGYSSRAGYSRGSSGGSSNYNPKIYSTRVTSTNISSSRISNTRTNPDSRNVTTDRAATMYSKQPQDTRVNTYLRPSFSTKGSREAYKRQDI